MPATPTKPMATPTIVPRATRWPEARRKTTTHRGTEAMVRAATAEGHVLLADAHEAVAGDEQEAAHEGRPQRAPAGVAARRSAVA